MNKRKSCITYLYQDSLARRMKELNVSRSELAKNDGAFTVHNPYCV